MTTALMLHRADGAPLSTAFRQAALSPDDPFAREREIAWEGPNAMSAGRASFVGERDVARFPHTETLAVVDGELTLTAPGSAPHVIGPGSGAVIASGTAVRIEAAAGVRFVFCAAACDTPTMPTTPTTPGLIPLHADADFKPSGGPAPEVLVGPAPQCRSDNVFTDEQTQYRAGSWDSTPYHRIVRPHPVNEFMYVLDGGVRFASPDGSALSVSAGDAIFVPQGASIGWESTERVAKFYVVQNAQA